MKDYLKRKELAILLVFFMLFCFSACGNETTNISAPSAASNSTLTVKPTIPPKQIEKVIPEEDIKSLEKEEDGLKSDGKIHVYIYGKGEKIFTPESSFINYITYYPESKHLIINMNNTDYAFANVPRSLWEKFMAADSVGKLYNSEMKNNSEYYIRDYAKGCGYDFVLEYEDEAPDINY